MSEFLQPLLANINWQFGFKEGLFIALLGLWLWAIWPKRMLAQIAKDRDQQWRLLCVLTAINTLWLLDASIDKQIHLHFLALVSLMLMYGWRMATLVALLPVMFFATFILKQPFYFAVFGLIAIALPLFCCFICYSLIFKHLPHHLFVYIFCAAFFNAFLSIVLHISAWSLWLALGEGYSWDYLQQNYLLLIPLLGFPEALLNGMAVTLMVIYRPYWLYDYSDHHYF